MSYLWWKHGVIYQIYPRSFQDSNGDGIGDLAGIIERLDYLNGSEHSLGVDAIWLSPTYPSPMADFGYDVADYEDVHPGFGTLATMDRLIEEAHKRGIRVILDFVPNHTSSEHPWFIESRSSAESAKRDWYIWRDPKPEGSPPNNWIAQFGGPAWEWDQRTQQYYLHSFLIEQPDVNWRNPDVEQAMHDVLRFWMRRGIDGFRIDVMDRIVKDPELRDNPPQPRREFGKLAQTLLQVHQYDQDWPDIMDYVRRIRAVVDEFPDRMTVGEVFGTPANIVRYYGGQTVDGLHLAFNFPLVRVWGERWTAELVRRRVREFEAALPPGAWPNWVVGNHDVDRVATRMNHDGLAADRARLAALLLLTLRGTPFLYYGDELGMENTDIPEEKLQDPARKYGRGRDPERTPMQWTPSGGFSRAEPWLPYGDLTRNVEDERADSDSMLAFQRKLLWTRRRSDALLVGAYADLPDVPDGVYAFTRTRGLDRTLTVLNFDTRPVAFDLPSALTVAATLAATHGNPPPSQRLELRGLEGRLLQLA